MKTFVFASLEQILNKLLKLDPESGRLLAPLDRKTIAITLEGLKLTIYCYLGDEKVSLMTDCYVEPHVHIKGTPIALLAAKYDPLGASAQGKISITGEDDAIQAFNQLIQHFRIDWEDLLSKVCGDTVAVNLSRFVNKVSQVTQTSAKAFATHMGEYLQHELNVLPPKQEINDFCNDVDKLRNDAERLFIRWQCLCSTKEPT